MQSVCKQFAPVILAIQCMGSGCQFIGTNPVGNRAHTLHNYISIKDEVKINEQDKSIVTGPFYVHTEFEVI